MFCMGMMMLNYRGKELSVLKMDFVCDVEIINDCFGNLCESIIYCLENGCKHFISDSKSGFDKDFNLFLLCLKLENKKNNRLTKLCLKDNSSLETLNSSHITRSYGGGSSNESGLYMAILKGDFEITKLMIDKWNSNININVKKR